MSWLLKQAEEILNRVDQQTNAAFHQPDQHSSTKVPRKDYEIEFITDTPLPIPARPPLNNWNEVGRMKKSVQPDLIDYLNRPSEQTVTLPLENCTPPDLIQSLQNENRHLIERQRQHERQLIQYQQQINESDALLRDLRSRESDANEILAAKESQLNFLRQRLAEVEDLLRLPNAQPEKHHLQSSLHDEQQQTQRWKDSFQQLEEEFNDYKVKAQRILQSKEQSIQRLQGLVEYRSSTPTLVDPPNDTNVFKQELHHRQTTIEQLRDELQQNDSQIHQINDEFHRLNEQLRDEQGRSNLLRQDFLALQDEHNREKKLFQKQFYEREQEIERLRLQITSKTINQTHDEELERRLQTLTESVLHKQCLIEQLQAERSSLNMKLERLEQRLDDYETIRNSSSTIPIDDLRHRSSLLRETPTDVDLTKKVKRAANELDQWAIRLTRFLQQYPFVRLALLFYIGLLHLWTLIVLWTYTPETHQ